MTKQKIKIDIVSDINCPWCYLGDQRLKKAMDEAGDNYEFEVHFKPFELSPQAPAEGENKMEYLLRNYGEDALDRIEMNNDRLVKMGEAEGAVFNFDKSTVIHNTFNGHRLIWLAGQFGVEEEVADALFKANFTDGKNVNDTAVLKEIGVANGIPADRLENFFESEEGKQEVRGLESWAQRSGVSGVPAFIFNDKYMVSGAQPAATLKEVFSQVSPAFQEIKTEGDSCGIDGNC